MGSAFLGKTKELRWLVSRVVIERLRFFHLGSRGVPVGFLQMPSTFRFDILSIMDGLERFSFSLSKIVFHLLIFLQGVE